MITFNITDTKGLGNGWKCTERTVQKCERNCKNQEIRDSSMRILMSIVKSESKVREIAGVECVYECKMRTLPHGDDVALTEVEGVGAGGASSSVRIHDSESKLKIKVTSLCLTGKKMYKKVYHKINECTINAIN